MNVVDVNFFKVLNIPVRYFVDKKILQNNYYELSRKYHPDKLLSMKVNSSELKSDQATSDRATIDFSGINEAYEILKNDLSRAEYIIGLYKITIPKSNQMPLALTDDYFELLETLDEAANEQVKQNKLQKFLEFIDSEIQNNNLKRDEFFKQWEEIERQASQAPARAPDQAQAATPGLEKLRFAAEAMTQNSYLISMKKDLEKKCQS